MRRTKKERQRLLSETIADNPFVTDEQLATQFQVSVQTIRLDRMELAIPELRERIKDVASKTYENEVKSLPIDEVIGEIIDIELDNRALSIFDVKEEHVFQRNGIARGHHLFAQANSLAVAVIDDELALTVHSNISFVKPVRAGDRVITKAIVIGRDEKSHRTKVELTSTVNGETVFVGEFDMYRTKGKGEQQ
ncbi:MULTISPECIES: transcription factor FapR [Lysinibacillus]|uniref:Transcription factor FapR n=1 Tax=Lysinibacillus xylanilyticus TaxID=582475 RepID=A0ABT4ELG7_9BACI|nr:MULTISPECIES: transcription factor FapR [Lysinibacillus]MBG9455286.1 fatty acid biosynthesis transcriptional regulator [Lysinibacillus sphaericus]MBG9478829.1 fatty acid biosynthesis transcriptional regulator [Lysinibacillus sphaericus]MBG9592557.1 fatty acid biosynthesis transcriptional regulator [Lysinibacillus sphaericus]MCY9545823.1 transcription factor FapR [Lysinibacillus xylanilyticus]MEB2298152.1 transcription factor FapR [Lysinibacillus xylanilyticus]